MKSHSNHNDLSIELLDEISERLSKITAISHCLLAARNSCMELSQDSLYNAIWIIQDYIDEMNTYFNKLIFKLNGYTEKI